MSEFEFDPDVIGSLPPRLTSHSVDVTGAATLPSPDAGAATADARSAISHLEAIASSLGGSFDDLARSIASCARLYAETDDHASLRMRLQMDLMI